MITRLNLSIDAMPKVMHRLIGQLFQFWDAALYGKQEPQVIWKRDRQGCSVIEIYDPITQKHIRVYSEKEARIWLEQRY